MVTHEALHALISEHRVAVRHEIRVDYKRYGILSSLLTQDDIDLVLTAFLNCVRDSHARPANSIEATPPTVASMESYAVDDEAAQWVPYAQSGLPDL